MKKTLLVSLITLFAIAKSFAQITTPLVLTVTVTPATVCLPPCNGTATVASVTGGTPPYTYLWNIPLGPQTTQTATGLCAGSYQIGVFDASTPLPKQGQAMVTITCNTANGISSLEADENIGIFPSPAQHEITVNINPAEQGKAEFIVRNILGAVMYSEIVESNGNFYKKLDISVFPEGIYVVEFIGRTAISRSKFVKQ